MQQDCAAALCINFLHITLYLHAVNVGLVTTCIVSSVRTWHANVCIPATVSQRSARKQLFDLCAETPAQPSQPAGPSEAPTATASVPGAPALQPPSTTAAGTPDADVGLQVFDRSLKLRRRKPGLELFQIGAIPKEHQAALDARAAEEAALAEAKASAALDSTGALSGAHEPAGVDHVPDIEWWDAAVLARGDYEAGDSGVVEAKLNKVTNLVEHPVPLDPPVDAPQVAPRALMLTKKVRIINPSLPECPKP